MLTLLYLHRKRAAQYTICVILAAHPIACRKQEVAEDPGQVRGSRKGSVQKREDRDGQETPGPHPKLTPEEVVRLQVEAIRNNDASDSGIAIAYRFLAPEYRDETGTVLRFAAIVKTPTFGALLGFQKVEYGRVRVEEDRAQQIVLLEDRDGNLDMFLFELIKLRDGPHQGCWMTNGIHPNSLDISIWTAPPCTRLAVSK